MARFYGTVHGRAKTNATRIGHKTTGLEVKANGWDIGARATMNYDALENRDVVTVEITDGSNGGNGVFIGKYVKDEAGKIIKIM